MGNTFRSCRIPLQELVALLRQYKQLVKVLPGYSTAERPELSVPEVKAQTHSRGTIGSGPSGAACH